MGDSKTIDWLFQRYLNNQCTPGEIKTLLEYFDAGADEVLLKGLIQQQLEIDNNKDCSPQHLPEPLLDKIFSNIKSAIDTDIQSGRKSVVSRYMQTWHRIAAAAVLILLLSTAAFFLFHKNEKTAIAYQENGIHQPQDIAPGHNNAVLTLSDGTTIVLDSAADGTLTKQGNSSVLKQNGQIAYRNTNNKVISEQLIYNTIAAANGNQYQLILADGTKVWLNAASSIRFPAAFTNSERSVEITGEAYFEVAPLHVKGQKVPFNVKINTASGYGGEVQVLGTHFNINAYNDEPDIKTTLLEGSVKVKQGNAVQMLVPGQQARLTANSVSMDKNVRVAQAIAWKEGFFWFNNTDIHTIMRQVARWYDVTIDFEGKITEDGFSGKIARNMPLSKVLKVLELSGVHFKTEGRKISVMP